MLKGENKRDRDGGRERMEVDVDALNHWWRSSRIHYGLSWKRDNARVVAMGEVARWGAAAAKCCVTKRCSEISTPTISCHYISIPTPLGRRRGGGPTWGVEYTGMCMCVCAQCVCETNRYSDVNGFLQGMLSHRGNKQGGDIGAARLCAKSR